MLLMEPQRYAPARAGPISITDVADLQRYELASSSRGRGWGGVTIDIYPAVRGLGESFPGLDHHMIGYSLSGGTELVQRRDGRVHRAASSPGIFLLVPAGQDAIWEGDAAASARMRVSTDLIRTASEQIGLRASTRMEIAGQFEARDPFIERFVHTILAELERKDHPAQRLIFETMSCALAAHLLRSYNLLGGIEECAPPALGRAELARLAQYVEDNIDRSISLGELAGVVNVSRFHFARLFKRSTGMTAIGYVEQCRIRRAQALILESGLALVEIALMTGFADQSHFTRRFRRQVGCTPAVFARQNGKRRAPSQFG